MAWLRPTAFWLGILLTSLTWRMAFHLVTAPDTDMALLASLTGTSCFVVSGATFSGRPFGFRSLMAALVGASAVLLATGVSTGALMRVGAVLHDIDIPGALGPAVETISTRLGLSGGLVTFWDGSVTHVVRITFEGLGLYEMWYVVVGATAACVVFAPGIGIRARARYVVSAAGLLAAYALVRFAVLVAIAIEFGRPDIMWRPEAAIVSYLPAALLLGRFCCPAPGACAVSLCRVGATAAAALALLAGTTLPRATARPGPVEQGPARVLIDESHSNWEWVTEPFDTTSFGIRAEYNYYCFGELLGEFYDVSVTEHGPTPESLCGADVLIIKTPTSPYAPDEIDAIAEFVSRGGGLLLIGDHTNLFGMTTYLNAISGRFGLRFRCDDTFDLATGGFSSHVPMGFWTHPLMTGIRRFGFLTSCTIEGGWGVEPIMVGTGLGSEDGDYGHPNFFGNISYDLADRFGVFLQAAGKRWGRGRVLLFTDSTCFSNFCMFSPGTADLALRFLEYVSCGRAGRAPASRVRRPHTVLVDTTRSRASFFEYVDLGSRPAWQRFEEFYISLARAGVHPVGGGIGDLGGLEPRGLIIVNPRLSFTRSEVEAVVGFIAGGGSLLILDGVINSESAANEILRPFGMGIITTPLAGGDCGTGAWARGVWLRPGLDIRGGEALVRDSTGRVTVARAAHGFGLVVVAVDSYSYSEVGLGRPLQPTHAYGPSLSRYRALFGLLEELSCAFQDPTPSQAPR